MEIWLRRVYDRTEKGPEERVLVDRLWPRGVKKEAIPTWAKQIAPSRELHDWYKDHDEDFQGFRERYEKELSLNPAVPPFLEFLEEKQRRKQCPCPPGLCAPCLTKGELTCVTKI